MRVCNPSYYWVFIVMGFLKGRRGAAKGKHVFTPKENQNHQNSSNEVEDRMLKGHPMSQIN
jgi:hypothetical protein